MSILLAVHCLVAEWSWIWIRFDLPWIIPTYSHDRCMILIRMVLGKISRKFWAALLRPCSVTHRFFTVACKRKKHYLSFASPIISNHIQEPRWGLNFVVNPGQDMRLIIWVLLEVKVCNPGHYNSNTRGPNIMWLKELCVGNGSELEIDVTNAGMVGVLEWLTFRLLRQFVASSSSYSHCMWKVFFAGLYSSAALLVASSALPIHFCS